MEEEKDDNLKKDQSPNFGDMSLISRNRYVIESDGGPFSRTERYGVKDEAGNTLCIAERQGELYKTISGIGLFLVLSFFLLVISTLDAHSSAVNLSALGICTVALVVFAVILLRPRHLFVYGSGNDREQVLRIIHGRVYSPFVSTYMIESSTGELLATLRRDRAVWNFFRAKMRCYGPDGSLLCTMIEDFDLLYWILSIGSSRYVGNLRIVEPIGARVIGKCSGKAIELAPEAHIDGRICLTMGLIACAEMRVT